MTLDDLRSLLAVAECKSFSAAARQLGCSQPAVSQHIQRLERDLGLPLFERQARAVIPTAAGEHFIRAAAESLTTLDRAVHRFEALRAGEAGSLVITTGGTTVHHFMRGAVKQFRRAYPRVQIQFRGATSSAECIEMLFRDPVDLAFVTIAEEIEGIRQHPVLELDYVLLTSRDHPLAKRSRLRLQDLDGLSCIGLTDGRTSRSQLSRSLGRHGVTLDTAMTVYDWDTAIHLVELGLGSSIVPSWHAHAAVARGPVTAVPITGLAPIRVGWALRESYELLPPARELMRLLKEDLATRTPQPGARLLPRRKPRTGE
jgi:DNA-binding transcriptional LysR family regulator